MAYEIPRNTTPFRVLQAFLTGYLGSILIYTFIQHLMCWWPGTVWRNDQYRYSDDRIRWSYIYGTRTWRFNTLRPEQNSRQTKFTNTFVFWFQFVCGGPIDIKSAFVQLITCCRITWTNDDLNNILLTIWHICSGIKMVSITFRQ